MGLCFRTAEAVALWPLPLPGKSIIPSYSFLQVICLLDAPAGQTQDKRESHVSKHCAFCLQVPSQPQETGDTLILVLLNLGIASACFTDSSMPWPMKIRVESTSGFLKYSF